MLVRRARNDELTEVFLMGYDAWGAELPVQMYLDSCLASYKYKLGEFYVLEDGNVVESGTHDELVGKNNGAYRAFWERQNRGLKRANTHKTGAAT